MSIPVPLAELSRAMQDYGPAYLLTISDDARVHAVSAIASVEGDLVRVPDLGRRTLVNSTARPSVTLLWPPLEVGGYSLIVDGEAEVRDDVVLVSPSRAVLHRPAVAKESSPSGACASDCVEVTLQEE
jgi:hypothetical protein